MQGLLEKLQSDTTRLAAVKAFGRIAESPLPLDMAPVLDRLLTELTSYLRKANRLLRQAALATIEVITSSLHNPCLCGSHRISLQPVTLQCLPRRLNAGRMQHTCPHPSHAQILQLFSFRSPASMWLWWATRQHAKC